MPRANGLTRQEILNCIKMSGPMTADELSRDLGISQVAVRQHLTSLEAETLIAVTVERRGLGRPSHRYSLTTEGDESFPRRYDAALNELLDELRAWQGQAAVDELLQRRRERTLLTLQSRMHDRSLTNRLNELARMETAHGFMMEVCSDGSEGFHLIKRNCSVCAVARNHPAICCQSESALYSQLLGDTHVERVSAIVDGDATCTFHIRPRQE
ncbi:MAG: putative transcriptional regulator [Chthonomonadales bacterium]|nr:putative transcriptional regulator [Chthonomonadales bacterium]